VTTHLRQVWERGETALGAFLYLREPLIAEAAALAGYDYVCIDMQHGLQSFDHTVTMLAAMARTACTPIVRVPANEASIIGRVLDAGAYGVIVPMVNSADEACAAAAACRYAPTGTRSMGPIGVLARTGRDEYFATANESVLCIPMIETKEAVACVDEIASVPGVDAIYIGPSDLSVSYGLAPKPDQTDTEWNEAIERVKAACERNGIVPGIHADAGLAEKRRSAGWRMITVGFDASTVLNGLRAQLAEARPR
jgi:4-hydroxy-2-oxoheptanedioate aldolase